jgi:hypothetical protein
MDLVYLDLVVVAAEIRPIIDSDVAFENYLIHSKIHTNFLDQLVVLFKVAFSDVFELVLIVRQLSLQIISCVEEVY